MATRKSPVWRKITNVGIFILLSILMREYVIACTTKGIMPMRDQKFNPFCCDPSLGNAHCPEGSRCERDTYYGHGYICCGSLNMVWDAYGGQYEKANYSGCGKSRPADATQGLTTDKSPSANLTMGAHVPRRWNGGRLIGEGPPDDYASIPSNWTSEADGPLVAPIIVGEYQELGQTNGWKGRASVTLVRDGSCTIVVDTGSAMDEKMIIKGLAAFDLRPEDVRYVVITQGTPEHMGNQNLFSKSKIFYAWITIDWDNFVVTDLGKSDYVKLCSRTELHLTPGITKDSISLLIRNVNRHGNVAIVGDLFLYEHAHDFIPKQYTGFIWDVQAVLHSREKIICQADVIVPGHGAKFLSQIFNKALSDGRFNCSRTANPAPTPQRIIHKGLLKSSEI